jgi:predicted transcriptional regulator
MPFYNGDHHMSESTAEKKSRDDILQMAVEVVSAYVSNNTVSATQIPDLIHTVFNSLNQTDGQTTEIKAEAPRPAVSIKRSITPEFIICLEDGKKLKMLKRHLRTTYNMTPDDYRVKWGLPPDYPMVAPNYAAQRSEFAKKIGLGRTASANLGPEKRGRRPRAK